MMVGPHPDDAALLSYVEGELAEAERAAVEQHLADCARCADDVELARQGAAALRGAPALDAPARPLPDLPERRRLVLPASRRFLAAAAPIAAGLAIVAGIATVATLGGSGNGGGGAGGEAAVTAASSEEGSGEQAPADQEASKAKAHAARTVAGPPRDVARTLRDRGFEAQAFGGRVVVRTDRKRDLARTLSSLPPGGVRIVVRP